MSRGGPPPYYFVAFPYPKIPRRPRRCQKPILRFLTSLRGRGPGPLACLQHSPSTATLSNSPTARTPPKPLSTASRQASHPGTDDPLASRNSTSWRAGGNESSFPPRPRPKLWLWLAAIGTLPNPAPPQIPGRCYAASGFRCRSTRFSRRLRRWSPSSSPSGGAVSASTTSRYGLQLLPAVAVFSAQFRARCCPFRPFSTKPARAYSRPRPRPFYGSGGALLASKMPASFSRGRSQHAGPRYVTGTTGRRIPASSRPILRYSWR